MQKFSIVTVFCFLISLGLTAQSAVNISASDCAGVNHDMYADLDRGVVVVLCWVMPCNQCVAPSITASKAVADLQQKYSGRVKLYMIDDYGNTTCTSLKSWAAQFGITPNEYTFFFSNKSIKMTDFGDEGMPKIAVMSGTDHAIIYHEENALDDSALRTAMSAALSTSPVEQMSEAPLSFDVFPNPATDNVNFTVQTDSKVPMQFGIYRNDGTLLQTISLTSGADGTKSVVDCSSYQNGVYFVQALPSGSSTTELSILGTNRKAKILRRMFCIQR